MRHLLLFWLKSDASWSWWEKIYIRYFLFWQTYICKVRFLCNDINLIVDLLWQHSRSILNFSQQKNNSKSAVRYEKRWEAAKHKTVRKRCALGGKPEDNRNDFLRIKVRRLAGGTYFDGRGYMLSVAPRWWVMTSAGNCRRMHMVFSCMQ